MTRIIAGAAGSIRLTVPPAGTRPTSDRVREAIFSALTAWNMLDRSRVLDLYAGSGALGLESASRGASEIVLVERHGPTARVAERNAKVVHRALEQIPSLSSVRIRAVKQSAQTFLDEQPPEPTWDVVFLDPPYDIPDASLAQALESLVPLLKPDAVVMVERSSRSAEPIWPLGLTPMKSKRYGETTLWWAEPEDTRAGTDST